MFQMSVSLNKKIKHSKKINSGGENEYFKPVPYFVTKKLSGDPAFII